MTKGLRTGMRRSVKTQWYLLYSIVLIIPMLVMMFAYRFSYDQLAEAVYDRQMAHLTLVRDLVDAEARTIGGTMTAFGANKRIREAAKVKSPAQEKKMDLLSSITSELAHAALNMSLIDEYVLYFPKSGYLVDELYVNPRRVISWDGYSGTISEAECAYILEQAKAGQLGILENHQGLSVLYTKVSVYRSSEPVYAAAVLSSSELSRLLGSTADDQSVISIESLDGQTHVSNDSARAEAFRADATGWFHAEIVSDVLPIRYVYASPTRLVEEKLTTYRHLTMAFMLLSLALGAAAICFAVRRQYEPVERLMQHFSSESEHLENEYQNISEYLLRAQARNDHHFIVDVLQGHVSHTDAYTWHQLLLISPIDQNVVLPAISRQSDLLPPCRVVEMPGHIACIFQHGTLDDAQIADLVECVLPEIPVYMVYSMHEGQSLHRAYADANDLLTTLRFFDTPPEKVYHAAASAKERPLQIMSTSFEEALRTAVFASSEEKAVQLVESALKNMQEHCHSGSLLRSSLYTISILFMRLEASIRAQNPQVPDGVAGDIVRSYRYTHMDQLRSGAQQAVHDMIAALQMQSSRKASTLYEQIDAYIREHYSNPDLSVDLIADHLNFSAVYIRRVYKQGGGCGIPDAILRLRIDAAKQALRQSGSKVSDVALQVGFLEAGTFIRSFKKVEGMTPGAYKSQFPLGDMDGQKPDEE